ncbi:unnamed protein product [Ectocarpus fasciculatus]
MSSADGFMSPAAAFLSAAGRATTSAATRRTPRTPTAMLSYADKLREAQAAKAAKAAGGGGGGQASPLSPEPASTPPPPAAAAAAAAAAPAPPMPQVAESPFSESLQEELRVAITILAARLQREKPMSRQEFERFESAVGVIVEDALPLQKLPSPASRASPVAAAAVAAPPPRLVVTQSPVPAADSDEDDDDDFETEGPEWDAEKVQYGLPMGARNTYDIDDMEKMNPDEYQAALRRVEKVVKRAQSVRKTGSYGNIVSNEYLKFLGKNPKTGDEKFKKNEEFVKSKGREDFRSYGRNASAK